MTHPEDIPTARDLVERAIGGESDGSAFVVRSHARPYRAGEWVQLLQPGPGRRADAAGRATRIMGVHEDVTEAERKEEAEREREERFGRASRLLALPR